MSEIERENEHLRNDIIRAYNDVDQLEMRIKNAVCNIIKEN